MEGNYSLEEKLDFIKIAILKYIPVRYIYLFGSHVYGDATSDSDIDIYAIAPDDFEEDMFLHGRICRELANLKIYEIDLHIVNEGIFNKFKSLSRFENTIYMKGSVLYVAT